MTMEEVEPPSTGFDQVIGKAYSLGFVNKETGLEILTTFDSPLTVALPYDQAQLTTLGISLGQVQVATFSNDTNSWTPLAQFSIDRANSTVSASLDRSATAIALIAPKPAEAGLSTIANDGPAVVIPFLLHAKSVITSTVEVPAGLTIRPGADSAPTDVAPVAVAEARITAPFEPTQKFVAREGEAALSSFKVDLFDAQGNLLQPGLLSKPLTLTLAVEEALLPQGLAVKSMGANRFNKKLSKWQPTQLIARQARLTSTGSSMVVVSSSFSGEFTVVVSKRLQVFLPLIMLPSGE